MTTRQYARLVAEWITGIGLDLHVFSTHSLRRTKATLIYRRTGNLRAVQLLLGHTRLESTVRYLGIEVDHALAIAVKCPGRADMLCPIPIGALCQERTSTAVQLFPRSGPEVAHSPARHAGLPVGERSAPVERLRKLEHALGWRVLSLPPHACRRAGSSARARAASLP